MRFRDLPVVKGAFGVYRLFISPGLHLLAGPGFGCRFEPTCSKYAQEAIHFHGFVRGVLLALGRIFRCHPFARGGYDPVPPRSLGQGLTDSEGL